MSESTEPVFQTTTLDNGLTLVGEANAAAQTFAAGYFVNAGSRDEHDEIAGVSHFLEHMMFKGSERRSAEDINREFDELGARYNAYTAEDRTVYYGAVMPDRRPQLLDLLSDMMRPALRPEDFDLEKKVILEEIAMYQDRPNVQAFERGNVHFYNGHPAGNTVLGTQGSISALQREQMLDYFTARYAPNNLTLVVAGRYDWPELVEQVTELTRDWRPQATERSYPEFTPASGEHRDADANLARAHVALYAPGVSAQDPRRYAAALLASCLGDADGSRLYWALVDKGLADAASLSHDAGDRIGAFVGYLSTAPERLEQVLDAYRGVLREAQRDGLQDAEWRRAQRKLATALTLRAETPFGRLMSLGVGRLYRGGYESLDDVVAGIMAADRASGEALLAERPFDALLSYALTPDA